VILLHGCNQQSGSGLLAQFHSPCTSFTEKVVDLLPGFGITPENILLDARTSHAMAVALSVPTSFTFSPLFKPDCCCHNCIFFPSLIMASRKKSALYRELERDY